MGREASAVTKFFFKPEGPDIFPVLDPGYGCQVLGRLAASRRAAVKMPETPLPGTSPSPCSPSGQS